MTELAYKFNPAGHEMPEEKRKYEEPDKRLQEMFEIWISTKEARTDNNYTHAVEFIEGIETTVEQAHGLLLKYQDHPDVKKAGTFVSAIYNKSKDETITYDLDIPVNDLAYRLEGKTFINRGTTGTYLGSTSNGNIINNGTTEDSMGISSQGNVINNGKTSGSMGAYAKGTVINNGTVRFRMGWGAEGNIINNGTAGSVGGMAQGITVNNGTKEEDVGWEAKGTIIDLGTRNIPELKQYLDNLKLQLTNPNMDEVLKVLEGLTRESLDKDIADILKRAKWQQH